MAELSVTELLDRIEAQLTNARLALAQEAEGDLLEAAWQLELRGQQLAELVANW